jgi:dTDP-4-dehydrorhamnose reductase
MMKIAITGTNGLLGQHLVQLLLNEGYSVVATGKGADRSSFGSSGKAYRYYELDIVDQLRMDELLQSEKPEVLVHAAAITQVDECELNQEQCEGVNVQGTATAIKVAEKYCRHFVFISTDFVFDGIEGSYSEDAELNPISFYGKTKQEGERLVSLAKIPWAIVRTCLVYGNVFSGSRTNIISWVIENLENNKPIRVVSDQFRTPTYVEDLAKGILLIIQQKATGIYHISGNEILTPYEIAQQTAHFLGLNSGLIEEVNASVFTQPAKRPPKTGFNISKARKELGYEPISFTEGLKKMLGE